MDHLDAYLAVRLRLEPIVRDCDPATRVPSCPAWSVRDVVAHLAGVCEDWVEHRLDGYASDEWTAAHVSRFSECSIDETLDRWRDAAIRFASLEDDPVVGPPARWAFGDAVSHEADIRGAVDSGHVPADAVVLALQGAIGRWRHVLRDAGTPTLLVRATGARDWWLGAPDDPEAVVAEVPAYEVFRALAGRRSDHQVRGWNWSAEPAPYLAAGPPYPFRWASADITD